MAFVGYDVCRIMMFVGTVIMFVAYNVCRIVMFVANYDICRL